MSTATSGITTFNLYHLCKKTDPSYEIVSHGKTLKAAIENCSGGTASFKTHSVSAEKAIKIAEALQRLLAE